ncbi:histone acetyltransferase type B catalytic subunit-like isoform X2 [Ptychodera flava]|uniref:histone acetyltransferase type B catalytic subunit-like isoform X2 n=1 Tax=Ptychodera flava TaxID=63121 RepID=UPI00396A02A5
MAVRTPADIDDDDKNFCPEFTHQIFGQNENIFGYKDLKIHLYYSAAQLNYYLSKSCSEKVDPARYDGVQADDVTRMIIEKLGIHPMDNLESFVTSLGKESNFTPSGMMLHSYKTHKDGVDQQFEIYKVDMSVAGFREYHEKLQTFLWWFIDAVSYIDVDDDRWQFYLLFEKFTVDGAARYSIVGYSTVYKYYAYPNKIRPRVSQMLVLPPYQRQGHGAQLLETIYIDYRQDLDVLDITVEDPSDDFIRLRDFVDCKACMHLSSFSPECLHQGFSDQMVQEAQEKLKINKKQTRRIYEILRLRVTDESNSEQFKQYRLDIKKRLNMPYQKEKSDLEKMRKVLKPEELAATMAGHSLQERHQNLEKMFQEQMEDYRKIVERLAML